MDGAKKFLFVSTEGLIGDLAWQVKKEGHFVRYFIKEAAEKDVCNGFVDKSVDWKADADWADVVVFNDLGFGREAEELRKQGKPVVGGSAYCDRLEDDREFGQDELRSAGVNVLPHWDFSDFDSAIKFIKENPGRYVLKPSGKAQNEKELLIAGEEEDGKDMLEILEHYKKNWAQKIKSFQLQRFVSGVEVAVGAFFNGNEFITPININFEHKRLFSGEIGPATGEMGTAMYWAPPNALFEATLDKMREKLAASGYVGYVDINCIANSRGIHPLEFTSRFGYPHISIAMEGVSSQWGGFLHGIAVGGKPELKTSKGFQVGIVVAVPPFPFHDLRTFKRFSEDAVIMFKRPPAAGVHLCDTKLVDGDWRVAGESGYALVVTGSGPTMEDARKQAYSRVQNIVLPNMFYRTDIG